MDSVYGSDVVVTSLQKLGIEHVAINPGASFRGLHESLTTAGDPQIIETLNENVAVAIAHGFAKASGRPMGVVLHNLVGLQAGSMGIFNAWVDQAPVLVLGGAGPTDHTQRRPWIDWIHSTRMQGLVVRDYVKWDDQPVSIGAFPESLARAYHLATAQPQGPTYVAVDALLQETEAPANLSYPSVTTRFGSIVPADDELAELADVLAAAERPVILADLLGRSEAAYLALRELAELLSAPVVDLGARHNFPTGHPNDFSLDRTKVLAEADVVLALDVRDLRWSLSTIDVEHHGYTMCISPDTTILSVGLLDLMHRGFLDFDGPMDGELLLTGDTGVALPRLVEMVRDVVVDNRAAQARAGWLVRLADARTDAPPVVAPNGAISPSQLIATAWEVVRDGPWLLSHSGTCPSPNYYSLRRYWQMDFFNSYLGRSGGGGLGYGLGASIGAGLGRPTDDTLVVNLQPDGDALETVSALWTAAHHRIPVLFVILNNRMYAQERMHQSTVGRLRGRPQHPTVGVDINDPAIDFAGLARAQGMEAWGPVTERDQLRDTLAKAAAVVRGEQRPALVDVVLHQ